MAASTPGEGLSQTPWGLGGILRERERLQLALQPVCSTNVFSRWTHTALGWVWSALSLPLCNSIVTAVLRD